MAAIHAAAVDTTYPDRNLIYQLWFYFSIVNDIPDLALRSILDLYLKYGKRYTDDNAMLLQFICECAIRNGDNDFAQKVLDDLLYIAPDFILAKVLQYRLEINQDKKAILLNNLKMNYPLHWMVKGL